MAGNAVRLSEELIGEARNEAAIMSRSITSQVEHWAKLGRAIEQSPGFDYGRVQSALRAQISPDDLAAEEREIYFVESAESLRHGNPEEDRFFAELRKRHAEQAVDTNVLGDK